MAAGKMRKNAVIYREQLEQVARHAKRVLDIPTDRERRMSATHPAFLDLIAAVAGLEQLEAQMGP